MCRFESRLQKLEMDKNGNGVQRWGLGRDGLFICAVKDASSIVICCFFNIRSTQRCGCVCLRPLSLHHLIGLQMTCWLHMLKNCAVLQESANKVDMPCRLATVGFLRRRPLLSMRCGVPTSWFCGKQLKPLVDAKLETLGSRSSVDHLSNREALRPLGPNYWLCIGHTSSHACFDFAKVAPSIFFAFRVGAAMSCRWRTQRERNKEREQEMPARAVYRYSSMINILCTAFWVPSRAIHTIRCYPHSESFVLILD